jgi:hypothetical protein
MSLIGLIVVLIVVGVLLWLVNTQLGTFIAPPILKIINVLVVIVVILWLLSVFGLLGSINNIHVGRVG